MANITLLGYLGADVECHKTKSGKTIAVTSIAVSYKAGNEYKTQWFNVTIFNPTKSDKYNRGDYVTITGNFDKSEYKAKNGTIKTSMGIVGMSGCIVKSEKPVKKSEWVEIKTDESSDIPF